MTNLASQVPTGATKQPLGVIADPAGDLSSKRLESLMAFGVAVLVVAATVILGALRVNLSNVPIVQLVIALLTYSAAMQGVSVFSERNLFPGGANTQATPSIGTFTTSNSVDAVVGKILGPTVTSSSTSTTVGGGR